MQAACRLNDGNGHPWYEANGIRRLGDSANNDKKFTDSLYNGDVELFAHFLSRFPSLSAFPFFCRFWLHYLTFYGTICS